MAPWPLWGSLSLSACLLQLMRMLCLPALRVSCTQGMVMAHGKCMGWNEISGEPIDCFGTSSVPSYCPPFHSITFHVLLLRATTTLLFMASDARPHFDAWRIIGKHACSLFFSDGGTACVSPRPSLSYPACCRRSTLV